MTREELDGAHFISVALGYKDTDPRRKFIAERTATSISTIDIHDGHTKDTYNITEKGDGTIELSGAWTVVVADATQCRAHINLMLPTYQGNTTEAERVLTRARAFEEGYTNFRGVVAQKLNWPEVPVPVA